MSGKLAFFRSTQSQALVDAVNQALVERQKTEAVADLGRLGLASLGVGAAARGVGGLVNMFNSPPKNTHGPTVVTMPYPVRDKKKKPKTAEDERPWRPGLTNLALGTGGALFGGAGGLVGGHRLGGEVVKTLDKIHRSIPPQAMDVGHAPGPLNVSPKPLWKNMRLAKSRGRGLGAILGLATGVLGGAGIGHLLGYRVENTPATRKSPSIKESADKTSLPWYRPAMALTGLAGLYGGWKSVDSVIDSHRRKAREKELADAKQEFNRVLLNDFGTGTKAASDSLVGRLENVFDLFQRVVGHVKTAGPLADLSGEAAGMYGTYAALSGLATGAIVYDQARKRQRRAILDKALKKRQEAHFRKSPPEIVAIPEPMGVS